MKESTTLQLGDEIFHPLECKFGINIQTDDQKSHDGISINYWIAISVDDHSGEDGAPAPEASYIPILRVNGNRNMLPMDLPGITVDDECDWDAWYGNDAPEITNNFIEFLKYKNGELVVNWLAEYGWKNKKPFHFKGALRADSILLNVTSENDVSYQMKKIFGEDIFYRITLNIGSWLSHGKWLNLSFKMANKSAQGIA